MIKFEFKPEKFSGMDICRSISRKFDETPYLKAVFFFCGVAQQLYNLGLFNESESLGALSTELSPCWHRLMDSGYRPDDIDLEIFSTISLMNTDITQSQLDEFVFWYHKFLGPNFFNEMDAFRSNECNQTV